MWISVGYSRRRTTIVQQLTGDRTSGVRLASIERSIDTVVQRQLRTETAGASYTSVKADFYARIDQIFGQPGAAGSVDAVFNDFVQGCKALPTIRAITQPGECALRCLEPDQPYQSGEPRHQSLRDGAEARIATAVDRMNTLLTGIDRINKQIVGTGLGTSGKAMPRFRTSATG